ncbi:MAG: nucleoside-diphosphate kinase [Acidimicrobiaceae bacterium]|nr:nucleoside-diphosphate kinase [Acidimicrobiaceae bacterium]
MGRTLLICKPDAVERGLVGEILSRIERKGLKIERLELRQLDAEVAKAHYQEHDGKPFFGELVEFITRSPSVLAVVTGPKSTYSMVRNIMGSTDPGSAAPGTIRGDLATEMGENLVHGSDSEESAARELELFFPGI